MINGFDASQTMTACKKKGRLVHVEHMQMRWGDMDALGHMNNTVYFRYFEQARISWFDGLGDRLSPGSEGPDPRQHQLPLRDPGRSIRPTSRSRCTWASPARSSFSVRMQMYPRPGDPRRSTPTAEAIMVWIDSRRGKSRPLPDWMRKRNLAQPSEAVDHGAR